MKLFLSHLGKPTSIKQLLVELLEAIAYKLGWQQYDYLFEIVLCLVNNISRFL